MTGCALSFAALTLTGGKVADMVGRRRVFVIGIVVFTVACFLCGIAESSELLIGACVQQRGMAIGIWAGVSALALAIGALVGGLLTEHVGSRAPAEPVDLGIAEAGDDPEVRTSVAGTCARCTTSSPTRCARRRPSA